MVTRQTLPDRKLIPSIVDMGVDWLRATPDITAIVAQRISSKLPMDEDDTIYPWLTVQRVIGITMTPEAPMDRACRC